MSGRMLILPYFNVSCIQLKKVGQEWDKSIKKEKGGHFHDRLNIYKPAITRDRKLAPQRGLEPRTRWLTATCSAD